MSMQFSSIELIDWTLSGVSTLRQGEPGSDGNEGLLCNEEYSTFHNALQKGHYQIV